jgi:nitrite reductase/ring-hydroxylating ferredoxin subunit
VVVGTWLGAWALDLLGGRDREAAADDLIAVGIVAAVPTALSGLSDWAELRGGTRRVGAVHALGNTLSLTLHAGSWCARKTGDRRLGARLSTLGVACAAFSAWLGGHLSFSRGVGVDQTVFEDLPRAWTPLVDEQSLESDVLVRRSAAGTDVLLVRHQGLIYALVDRCSHRGCSLSKGSLVDDTIVCSCHGSRFALDGALLAGPATAPQPSLETRVQEGKVEVRDRAAPEDSTEAAHA